MSANQRIIHVADLSAIELGLRSIRQDVGVVSQQVEHVGSEVATTRTDLARLERAFLAFVEADSKAKQVALSETRLVKIRQELDTKYGHYAKVRRHATGILQAADISIVRQETVNSATEELMLDAPRYWLAPALVSLAAWLADNRTLAEKSLAEALRRDDEKTSLFFGLIARRAGRTRATFTWLDRYFGMQDPTYLDRQAVVLVNALASGVFGTDIRTQCSKRIEAWIDELSQRAGFLEEQRQQWNEALRSKIPMNANNAQRYPNLAQYSPTWNHLDNSLRATSMHAVVQNQFQGIFSGPISPSANLAAAVDNLLDNLVRNFDDEELPLRRDERLCELIIAEDGNRDAANSRFDLEHKALEEQVSFTQLLTNAAMHPEMSHSTQATQRYAIALSRNWIKDAHQDLTATIRSAIPSTITISIEDWVGHTRNGENEEELSQDLQVHIESRKQAELAKIKLGFLHWAALILGTILILSAFSGGILPLVIGAGAVIWFFVARNNVEKTRVRIAEDFERLKEQSVNVLRACMAELVEVRREIARKDAISDEVVKLLDAISPSQYMSMAHDKARQVMVTPTAA